MKTWASFRQLIKPVGLTLIVGLLGLASAPSYAGGVPRHILIDFGFSTPTSGTNDTNGEAWQINPGTCIPLDQDGSSAVGCVLDFSSPALAATSSGPVSLGFDVNLNGVTYKQVHVNQNGVVTFVAALGAYTPVNDFASLQTVAGAGNPFIAAFYPGTTALSIPLAGNPADMGFNGGAEYGRGLANPTGTDVGTSPDIDGDVPAFKASWFECPAGSSNLNCVAFPTNPVQARIVLYNRYDGTTATTDGDFDLRFEFNSVYDAGSGQYGVIGFSLGSTANTVNLSGTSTAPTGVPGLTDIYYQFRNGVLVGAVTAVIVPNVSNDTLAGASTAIIAAGLIVGTTTAQSSTTVPSGSVVSQDPVAGASAAPGSAVNLVVSSGKPLVSVPNVVNDTLAAGTSALTTVGLVVGSTTHQTSLTVPSGSIISQSPTGGSVVTAGTLVNLVVSAGALRGDINLDGQVDILDLVDILEAFGKKVGPGDPRDLNGDRVINLKDAVILVSLCTHRGCSR